MGKVTIEFDSIEEMDDVRDALDGYKWKLAVWDLDQALREIVKYDTHKNREVTKEEYDMAEYFRGEIRRILNDYNLVME